jgi:methanogenic corrinoid protein MtbC1
LNSQATARQRRFPVGAFVKALREADYDAALAIALDVRARAGSRLAVFVDLLQPAQYEIGELWYRGEIRVDDEHRATAVVARVTEALPPSPSERPVPPGAHCLMAAMGEEQHVLGLRQLRLAFEDDGWPVTVMGPRVQAEALAERVRDTRPSVVCVSAGYLPAPAPVRRAIETVRALGVPVLVGGPAFNRSPGLWRQVGADDHGPDARVALVLARRRLR